MESHKILQIVKKQIIDLKDFLLSIFSYYKVNTLMGYQLTINLTNELILRAAVNSLPFAVVVDAKVAKTHSGTSQSWTIQWLKISIGNTPIGESNVII